MFLSVWLVVATLLSTLYFIKWFNCRRDLSTVYQQIPGPKPYPLIGNIYPFIAAKREERYSVKQKLHDQFQSIILLWYGPIPQVSLKRADHLEKILCNSRQHLQKSWGYENLRPWLGDGLIMSTSDRWHQMRKMLTPAFHFGVLERFCEVFTEKANHLVDTLQEYADTGESFAIYPIITQTALEIVAQAAMGSKLNSLDKTDRQYIESVYNASVLFIKRLFSPWHQYQCIYNVSTSGRLFAKCCSIMHAFTNKVIEERINIRNTDKDVIKLANKQRPTFLDIMLMESEQQNTSLTKTEIRDEVENIMFAGHDTTSSAISWIVYMLGRHPGIQEDLFAEITIVLNEPNQRPTTHDLNQLELLDRVIKETLRIYPPVPFVGRQLSEDVRIDDQYVLPKGTQVAIEITQLHRDPEFFPQPERFDPDRFLPNNVHGRHPLAYIPFSAGSRNCIGQRFSGYAMKSVLVALIRNFRFKGVGPEEIPIEELITKPFYGVEVVCSRRL